MECYSSYLKKNVAKIKKDVMYLLSKGNYKRLQEMCKEINEIMLESDLNEITLITKYKDWHHKENNAEIYTRKYIDFKQNFNYGTMVFSTDKEEYLPEYKWNYEEFIKERR